jgi:hypothetical protein
MERGDEMPTIRSEPCKNCDVEVYIDFIDGDEGREWIWAHLPGVAGACDKPEPRRRRSGDAPGLRSAESRTRSRRSGRVFWVGPGEL